MIPDFITVNNFRVSGKLSNGFTGLCAGLATLKAAESRLLIYGPTPVRRSFNEC